MHKSLQVIFDGPDAYPTHEVWATVLQILIARGPEVLSVAHTSAKFFATGKIGAAFQIETILIHTLRQVHSK